MEEGGRIYFGSLDKQKAVEQAVLHFLSPF